MSIKRLLRHAFLAQRRRLTAPLIQAYSQQILAHLIKLTQWQQAKMVGTYLPFDKEVDSTPVLTLKPCALPRLDPELDFYAFETFSSLKPHPQFGILEPPSTQAVSADKLDLFLVPVVAFHPKGYRLGRGQGHYDKFFQRTACQGFKIGLAYSWQRAYFPYDSWDVPLDLIITEEGCIQP